MDYKAIEAIPGWYSVAKKAGELYDTLDAYEKVPMLHRAVNLRAEALGTVPYQLERNGVYVDYPFVTPLESLIQQTEKALLLFGHAFWLRLMRGRVLYGFQYLQPQSVRITFDESRIVNGDPMTGVLFSQQIGSRIFGPWTISEVVYFREPSVKDDIHAGTSSAQVALQSARLAYYLERFSSAFFEHGAQPALVMSLDKSITPPEYERLKSSWSRYAENVSNAFKTFFFRGEVNAQVITFPLKDLELVALQERTTTNIVTTFGVPRTMLEASAANYATADSDRQSFWRETIVPRLAFYERVLNSQLLAPLKYKLIFQPEQLSVFQTDEAARADSLVKLVQAGMSLDEAKYRLGYEDVSEALGLQQAGPQPDATGVSEDSGNAVVDESLNDLATKRSAELGAFERKALKRLKSKGTAAGTTFESDVLPRYLLDYVELELKGTKKKIDVTQLFAWLKLTLSDLTPDERRVYRLIADKLAARVDDTAAAIAAGDYTRIDTDLRNILTEEVAQAVLRAGANRVTPIAGIPNAQSRQLVEQALQQVESSYLSAYWNPFLQDLSETERDYIARVVQQAQSTVGYTTDDIRNSLSMFGDLRAQRIAFTEPTRAAAQQMNALQQLATQRGINTQRVWRIINDLEVCDECAEELDGTTEDVWAVKYPDGPPAHVNCRCVIILQLMPSLITEPDTSALPEVPEPQQELPLLQRTPAQMIDALIDIVPDSSKSAMAELDRLIAEVNLLKSQITSTTDATQRAVLVQQYKQLYAEQMKQLERTYQTESATFDRVLPLLANPNPQQVEVSFIGSFTQEQKAYITRHITQTVAIAPQMANGTKMNINVVQGPASRAGGYRAAGRRLDIAVPEDAQTIVHETIHAMQHQLGYGIDATNIYGYSATAGRKPTSMNGYKVYKGITDNDYAFRVYPPSRLMGDWTEILTTSLERISSYDRQQDRSILELAMQVIKDGGK